MSLLQEMGTLLTTRADFFLKLVGEHLAISLIAILIAIALGGVVGILITAYQRSAKPTLAVVSFLYTIPSISMLGFLIPFSGIGNATAVIALTIYALLPMVRSTHTGMSNIDAGILEAAKGMGSTKMQSLLRIQLPLAMPVILSGIRSMATMTIALAGIASFIGAGGLGVAIYRGITTNNTAMTLVGSLLIAALALGVDVLLGVVERRVQRKVTTRKSKVALGVAAAVVCASVIVAVAVNAPGAVVRVATKPMTEQYVLGEMLDILIEQDTDLTVELTQGVGGGTSNIQPGMESGAFDLYPEYTGTGWNMVLKETGVYAESEFDALQAAYTERLNMQWMGMYGFNNTYGLAVRSEIAQQYGIQTYSDLAAVSDRLRFGAEYDFYEREDGYDALCDAYGMRFASTVDLDIGLKYQAMNQGKIDVMNIFTTDGQLSTADVVVLVDDRGFYPSYQCGNVVRNQILQEHPELAEVLFKLDGILTDEEMARVNYEVENNGAEPRQLAQEILNSKGLLHGALSDE